jgi:hypothetical protein
VLDAAAPQPLRIEEALHGVKLHERIRDRRAGGKGDTVTRMQFVKVAAFHVKVEGPLRSSDLYPGDPLHFRRGFEVLEVMGFVDEQMVNSKLIEHQPIILLFLGKQVFQAGFPCGLLFL